MIRSQRRQFSLSKENRTFLPLSGPVSLTLRGARVPAPPEGRVPRLSRRVSSTAHLAPTPVSSQDTGILCWKEGLLQLFHFWVYLLPLQVLTTGLRQDEQTCQIKDLWQKAEESWKQINLGLARQLGPQERKGLFPLIFFCPLIRSQYYSGDTHSHQYPAIAEVMKRLGGPLRTLSEFWEPLPFLPSSKGGGGVQQEPLWGRTHQGSEPPSSMAIHHGH